MGMITGITWDHTRGFMPMVATAQRFSELNPDVQITWHKRSLKDFADASLAKLTAQFDLLVIDHPSIGEAAKHELLLPLEDLLPAAFLADQSANSVGASHASYNYDGRQYALAIDAAAPVSGWRPDLLESAGSDVPQTWDDLMALARRGLVTVPAIPIDSLMNFFMLANALGAEPFGQEAIVVPQSQGSQALEMLRELVQLSALGSGYRNPIHTWQFLADSDSVAYCPFAYGYSNYSRVGYAAQRLRTGGLVSVAGNRLRSTLGGAGLAISRKSKDITTSLAYAAFTASPAVQATIYAQSGGQPGHRAAWIDPELNRQTDGFFMNTLLTLEETWVRPRFPGFIAFQETASRHVHEYLFHGGSPATTVDVINRTLWQTKG